jgi:hypothetical protein
MVSPTAPTVLTAAAATTARRPVARPYVVAAHAVSLLVLPSCVWRILLGAGVTLGFPRAALEASDMPGWVPHLGSRRIPPLAVVLPAALGGVALTVTVDGGRRQPVLRRGDLGRDCSTSPRPPTGHRAPSRARHRSARCRPEEVWLSRGFLRAYSRSRPVSWVCQLDAWPNNLITRHDGEPVWLDWAFVGDGAL